MQIQLFSNNYEILKLKKKERVSIQFYNKSINILNNFLAAVTPS